MRFRSPLHIKKRYIFLELNNDKFSHSSPAVLYKDLSQKYPIIAAKIANDNISVPDPDLSFDYEYFYNSTEAQSSVVSLAINDYNLSPHQLIQQSSQQSNSLSFSQDQSASAMHNLINCQTLNLNSHLLLIILPLTNKLI